MEEQNNKINEKESGCAKVPYILPIILSSIAAVFALIAMIFSIINFMDNTQKIAVSDDGHWIIDGVKSAYNVEGEKGDDGKTPTIEIDSEGYWVINGEKTAYRAEPETLTVTFDTAGGSEVESQEIELGKKVKQPEKPVRSGYVFNGWYLGDEKWNFIGYNVTEDITLTAKWSKIYSYSSPSKKPSVNDDTDGTVGDV